MTKEIFTVTNETYINAESVCRLLTNIAARYAREMITIVLDNARYQKCELVLHHAARLGIELLFLPSYSPHLNLIERLWRFVRKECLYSKYYPMFDGFKQALTACIQNAHTKHRDELDTLLAWNFQSFEKALVQRGSLTFWLSDDFEKTWRYVGENTAAASLITVLGLFCSC